MCTRNLVLHKEKMVRPDHCPSVFAHSQQQTESQLLRVGSSDIPTVNIISFAGLVRVCEAYLLGICRTNDVRS